MYKFTEEQIMIRDMVREFTKNEVAPYDKAMDETFSFNMEIYQQIYSKLVETGLMGIHIPEQYGGGGGDAITSQIVVNELAKGSASIALYLDANSAVPTPPTSSIFSVNSPPLAYILPRPHKILSEHVYK